MREKESGVEKRDVCVCVCVRDTYVGSYTA